MKKLVSLFVIVTAAVCVSNAKSEAILNYTVNCPEPFYFNGESCVPSQMPSDRAGGFNKFTIYPRPQKSKIKEPVILGPDGKPLDEKEYRKQIIK